MWLKKYINEWKTWRVVRKIYKENQKEFEKMQLKSDWFGKLYKVINRDPEIKLGTPEDERLLSQELNELSNFLIKMNIMDIVAYELIPLEKSDETSFENAYLITLTPAYDLNKQYVTFASTLILFFCTCAIITGIIFGLKWLI